MRDRPMGRREIQSSSRSIPCATADSRQPLLGGLGIGVTLELVRTPRGGVVRGPPPALAAPAAGRVLLDEPVLGQHP